MTKPRSRAAEMTILAPYPGKHLDGVAELIAKSFPGDGSYYDAYRGIRRSLQKNHYDWQASRIGILDDTVVAHWGVYEYRTRIGSARIRTAGIGAVATHGEYRRQGLMARLIREWLHAMRQSPYPLTVLFGIRGFYHKFGYVYAWPKAYYKVETQFLPDAQTPKTHAVTRKVQADLDALYNRENRGLTGTAVRPTYASRDWRRHKARYWCDASGKPAGFLICGWWGGGFQLLDHVGDPTIVLSLLRKEASRQNVRVVELPRLHHHGRLARHLRWNFPECEEYRKYSISGGAMAHVLQLESMLLGMRAELQRRLKASEMADWEGTLLVSDGRERVGLAIRRGEVRIEISPGRCPHAIRAGDNAAQLLLGSVEPGEILDEAGIRVRGDGRRLAEILFPAQQPMLAGWDQY